MTRLGLVCLVLAGMFVLQAMADQSEVNPVQVKVQSSVEANEVAEGTADQPASSPATNDESIEAEAPEIRRLGKHDPSSDHHNSNVGGKVIIGGLVTAFFAAVFCYIRVTRKRNGDQHCGH